MELTQCPQGVTQDELEMILGDRLPTFDRWMVGQTMSICDGRSYNHEKREYEATECADSPHGVVVYRSDLERFQRGLPIYDWLSTRDRRCLDDGLSLTRRLRSARTSRA